jgi:hypothetical protein
MVNTLADLLSSGIPVAQRPALLFENEVYTCAELEALSNRVAHVLIGQGLQSSNVVCQVNLFGILKSGAIRVQAADRLRPRPIFFASLDLALAYFGATIG